MSYAPSEVVVLPAANRNYFSIMCVSPSGLIAYGSRYQIYFVAIHNHRTKLLDSKVIQGAHRGKVIALSFSKGDVELLASIGDDCQLKVWDLETLTCLNTLEVRESTHNVAWVYGSANIVLFSPDPKTISKLNIKLNKSSRIKIGSEISVSAIECNEKLPELVAIGHDNGIVSIVNVVQEKLLQVLKTHSMEVTSLSWSGISPDTLMSVSFDLTVRVWKMKEDKPIRTYYFPSIRQKMDDKKKFRPLGTFHPNNPNVIICTTPRGELGEITFEEKGKPNFASYTFLDSDYLKFPCSLICLPDSENKENTLLCCDSYKVTVADINKQKVVNQIPFLMGFVYGLTNSVVNPNLLAISNGDGILRVWNTQAEGAKIDMMSIYVHFKTKIMTTTWHPTEENILAYGTDEGRVGIADTYKRRVMYSFETHHSDSVYSLSWGPCEKAHTTDGGNDSFYLYSCGGGQVYVHKLKDITKKALNFGDLAEWPPDLETTEKTWTEIVWRPDYSYLCLGSSKGCIDVFSDKLVFLARYNVQMKSVECLCWHPENTYMSPNGSPFKFWLASCGSDADIHIFDVPKPFSTAEGEKTQPQEAFKKLVGHKKRIVSLCWSQHDDGFLVSASKDCTVLVWNVSSGSIIATYLGHKDVVYAVQWSVFDKDVIYSGGLDSSVKVWKISEQSILEIPVKVQCRKRMRKPKKFTSSSGSTYENNPSEVKDNLSVVNDLDDMKIEPETNAEDTLSIENGYSNCVFNQSQEEKKDSNKTTPEFKAAKASKQARTTPQFAKKFVQLFPEHALTKNANFQDVIECERLADILCNKTSLPSDVIQHMNLSESEQVSDDDAIKCGPFTDQLTTLRMLQIRGEITKAAGDYHSSAQLGIMAADVKSVLQEAAENNSLSAYLISLAPCVSYTFWREMCEKYAVQLVQEHSYYAASNYYLMCNKIYDAINILAEKENPVDALILAKAHLPQSDPIFSKLLFKAAKKYAILGNKIGEAKCYLALSEPLMAAKVLASYSDPNFIRTASFICKKFNLEKDANIYAFMCLEKCLLTCNWSSFELLLNQEPKMQVYKALTAIHESFQIKFRSLKNKNGIILKEIFPFGDPIDEVRIWNGNTCTNESLSFIDHVYHYLLPEQSDLREMLEALNFLSEKHIISTSSHAQVCVTIFITKFVILCHLEEYGLASQVFLKIFEVACNDCYLQKIVSFLLLPLGLYWCNDTRSFNCTTLASINEKNSVLFYRTICDTLIGKINSFEYQSIKSVTIIREELLLDVQYATNRMCSILSTKTAADYALSYFSVSVLDCLLKAVNDKIQPLKCLANLNSNIIFSESDVALQNGFIDKNSPDEDEKEKNSDIETGICSSSSQVGAILQEDIELTLKKTEENTPLLKTSETDTAICSSSYEVDAILQEVIELKTEGNAPSFIKNNLLGASEENGISLETSDTASSDFVQIANPCINVNEKISLSESNAHSTEISGENSTNEESIAPLNSHMHCLESIELFFNTITFIAFNICQDEYALLYYLKRRVDIINAANASEVLSKFSKDNKIESKVSEHALNVISSDSKKEIKENVMDVVPKSQEPQKIDGMNEYVTNGVTNSDFLEVNLNLNAQSSLEDLSVSCIDAIKCIELDKVAEVGSLDHNELDEISCENHDAIAVPKESVCFMNTEGSVNISNELISMENRSTNESLSSELPELVELISTLENIIQIRYPNPFKAIPKILQIIYKVKQNSQCCLVQDKLHEFIHEVISWSNKFSYTELDLVCDSCSKERK